MKEEHLKLIKSKVRNVTSSLRGHTLTIEQYNSLATDMITLLDTVRESKKVIEREIALKR